MLQNDNLGLFYEKENLMKIPFRFQMTEFDCGTTTFCNALSFLYEREEIPIELVKGIFNYTLDMYNKSGTFGEGGTSRSATTFLTDWINHYSDIHHFDLHCEKKDGTIVSINLLKNNLNQRSVIILRLWSLVEHYVLLLKIDENFAYIFDPYFQNNHFYDEQKEIKIILKNPFSYNRKISVKRLESTNYHLDYALGNKSKRECIIMRRNYYEHGKNG